MRNRLAKFSLSLHLEKTRLIEFGRFAAISRDQRRLRKREMFKFLGFSVLRRRRGGGWSNGGGVEEEL